MRKNSNRLLMVLAVVVCVGWIATQSKSQQQPEMSAEQKAQMEAWMKLAAVGPQHEAMKAMVGKFTVDCTMVEKPGGPEQKSTGACTNELIFEGRFLQSRFSGNWAGQPFEGIGYSGYDNFKKKYISTWMDSMGTMIMYQEGTGDPAGKVVTYTSEMPDPVKGTMVKCRTVSTLVSNDKHTFEMFAAGPDGKEFKCMAMVYTRAK